MECTVAVFKLRANEINILDKSVARQKRKEMKTNDGEKNKQHSGKRKRNLAENYFSLW